MMGSKGLSHWTSETVYECSEIADSPQIIIYSMDILYENETWTCSTDMQHGQAAWTQAAWTNSGDMQHGHASQTSIMDMHHRHAAWTYNMDTQVFI
jgi:hypothetical protein